jgi:hypothetical protein
MNSTDIGGRLELLARRARNFESLGSGQTIGNIVAETIFPVNCFSMFSSVGKLGNVFFATERFRDSLGIVAAIMFAQKHNVS